MNELLYGVSSVLIAAVLLVSMLAAMEAGYRLGRHREGTADDEARSHINAIQGSILGILALLLAFTLSLSLQRFDSRSEAVVDEANAIGTAWLRAQLLPEPVRDSVVEGLRRYVDLRVEASARPLPDPRSSGDAVRIDQTQASLWKHALRAAEIEPSPVRTGLFVQALNDAFDAYGRREASLARHVPEVVLLLLYATFLIAGGVLGFSSGVAGHRPSRVSLALVALMVVLVFIILDLDRPRRGLIEVSQKSLTDLRASIGRGPLSFGAASGALR